MTIPVGYKCNQWGWFWKESDNSGPYYLDAQGVMTQGFPNKFYTDEDGPYARLRVDVGQTGFFAGREFSVFHEYSIPTGQMATLKVVSAVDVFIQSFGIDNWAGDTRLEVRAGCTETVPFVNPLPILRTNQSSTADFSYASQVTFTNGGSVTGGILIDAMQANSGNKNAIVDSSNDSVIGLPANIHYMIITNIGNQPCSGAFRARWEERP